MELPDLPNIETSIFTVLTKEIIQPIIKKIKENSTSPSLDEESIKSNFEIYLSQRYEKYLLIDTLVFPNRQTLLGTLYEPLSITSYQFPSNATISFIIDKYPDNFLQKYGRVLIEDVAGMGKSTIVHKLFLSIIDQTVGVPILIELRKINSSNSFFDEIQNQISNTNFTIPLDFIIKLLNEGHFIFLLDGFDEISNFDKDFTLNNLRNFIERCNNNLFLITSRPNESLVSFGDFYKFNIDLLDESKALSLLRRYDEYSEVKIANELENNIKGEKFKSLKEFLSNPFLISLLYKSFEYKKDIPIKKSQFYRQVFEALFESHDLSKGGYFKREKYSNLHLDDFEKVLRFLGYFSSIENETEFDKDKLISKIDKLKSYIPDLSFKTTDFIKDLIETVPLFRRDGNYIRWAHKSLQDYFSAKFIWLDSRQNQNTILKKIFHDPQNNKFYNVLDIFFELDINIFKKTILLWLLEDLNNFRKNIYQKLDNIPNDLINDRIEYSYNKDFALIVTKTDDYEILKNGGSEDLDNYYLEKIKPYKYHTRYYNYFKEPQLIVFTCIDSRQNIDNILRLLSQKMPNLVTLATKKTNYDLLPLLSEDNLYLIDDNKENIVNNIDIFSLVTDLIKTDFRIHLNTSTQLMNEINELLTFESSENFTKW